MIQAPSTKNEDYRFTSLKSINWNEAPPKLPQGGVRVALPQVLSEDAFANLNLEYTSEVKRISISKKSTPQKVQIGEHVSSKDATYTRTIVEIAPETVVTLVDNLSGSPQLFNHVLEIHVGESAQVEWVHLQNLSRSTLGFLRTHITLADRAEFRGVLATVGGLKNQSRIEVTLKGSGSHLNMMSATRGMIDQHFDHWTTITHDQGQTTSSLKHWAVMGDQARAVFNGKVIIPRHARGCDAYQKNINLLLSKQAVIDSIPKLEIATDEVKCAHGSSISPVSEDHLYYLESRGIDRSLAESMLVDGFTEPVLQQISDEEIRSQVRLALVGHTSDGGWE